MATVVVALAALAVAVVLVAIPLTRRFVIVALAEWMLGGSLESLAVDLDIQPGLRWIFNLLVILPVGFGLARMVMAGKFNSALRGLALALGTLFLVGVAAWWQTRHFNFDAHDRPVVYLSFRRDGVHKSYSPGVDQVTGRAKESVTLERVVWLTDLARQPARAVDPAVERNWFDANTGDPNLWYAQTGSNEWQFFNRPMFHPQLGVELLPVSREVMARWQAEHDRQEAAAKFVVENKRQKERAAAEQREREEGERVEKLRLAEIAAKSESEARMREEVRNAQFRREQLEAQKQAAAEVRSACRDLVKTAPQTSTTSPPRHTEVEHASQTATPPYRNVSAVVSVTTWRNSVTIEQTVSTPVSVPPPQPYYVVSTSVPASYYSGLPPITVWHDPYHAVPSSYQVAPAYVPRYRSPCYTTVPTIKYTYVPCFRNPVGSTHAYGGARRR
jgi:hypothetical protein